MTHEQIKKEFLDSLSIQNDKIPPLYLSVVDEAVESVLHGTTNINGSAPKDTNERIYCIGQHLILSLKALEAMKEGIRSNPQLEQSSLTLTYRGQTYKI